MSFIRTTTFVSGLLIGFLFVSVTTAADRPNVLFIAVDDLRPELACYGADKIHSPNIDRLAASGVMFNRAYCMVPTCGASRASMMTGIRPTPKRFVSYLASAEQEAPGITTLNTHLKSNGYNTISLGKVFHHKADNAAGWNEPAWGPKGGGYQLAENQKLRRQRQRDGNRGPAWESADVDDANYTDGMVAAKAIEQLDNLSNQDAPFFLAVGFVKPHLPFVAPKKYWDLYDADEIEVPANYHVGKDAPKESIHTSGELRRYAGISKDPILPEPTAKKLIHGYRACVSFVDAQIGRVLDHLQSSGLADNTIVVLWGDHGWNLGEHTLWCKHSCYETSMRIPLIIRAPKLLAVGKSNAIVESIDLYPTLCDLTSTLKPQHLKGRSLKKLLVDPSTAWNNVAVGRYQNGDTIRSDRFRLSVYRNRKTKAKVAAMLYDHETDPQEDKNIVDKEESAVAKLSSLMWKINRQSESPTK